MNYANDLGVLDPNRILSVTSVGGYTPNPSSNPYAPQPTQPTQSSQPTQPPQPTTGATQPPQAPVNSMPRANLGMGTMQYNQIPYQQTTTGFGQNQNTQNLANALTAQSNQNLAQNVMPQISQGAQLAGQYGGSRQGIAEGVAAGNAQAGLNASIAGLYSQAYGQDQNFYTQQRGQDQLGMQLGANLYNMGNTGNLGVGAGQYQLGQTYMNAPLTAAQNYAGIVNPYSGLGGSSTTGGGSSSTSTVTDSGSAGQKVGGGLQGFAGGALAGWQMGSNFGLG